MEFKNLDFEINNNIATIKINRPKANNAIDLNFAKDLMDVSIICSENTEVKAIIITGAGKLFCPGGDLKAFNSQKDNLSNHLKELTTYLHAAISRFTRSSAPVITAVNGIAAGAGMSLACSGDIIFAAQSAKFTAAYTRIGLTPDGSLTYFLPRLIGLRRAIELVVTNRIISANEAMEMGLVSRVIPDDELLTRANETAVELASGATEAIGISKQLMHSGFYQTLETQMELESQSLAKMASTIEARQRIEAFLNKS